MRAPRAFRCTRIGLRLVNNVIALLCYRISLNLLITSVDKSFFSFAITSCTVLEKKSLISVSRDMLNIEFEGGISCFKVRLITLIKLFMRNRKGLRTVGAEVSKVPDGRGVIIWNVSRRVTTVRERKLVVVRRRSRSTRVQRRRAKCV